MATPGTTRGEGLGEGLAAHLRCLFLPVRDSIDRLLLLEEAIASSGSTPRTRGRQAGGSEAVAAENNCVQLPGANDAGV